MLAAVVHCSLTGEWLTTDLRSAHSCHRTLCRTAPPATRWSCSCSWNSSWSTTTYPTSSLLSCPEILCNVRHLAYNYTCPTTHTRVLHNLYTCTSRDLYHPCRSELQSNQCSPSIRAAVRAVTSLSYEAASPSSTSAVAPLWYHVMIPRTVAVCVCVSVCMIVLDTSGRMQ